MPRSSRTKSRKHSSKEHSDSDVDVVKLKPNNGSKNDVVSVRVSKHAKDVTNGDSDRWNGSDEKGLVVNVDDVSKPKDSKAKEVVKGDLKSRSSKRHDAESAVLTDESKRGEKRKSEKEVSRKEHKEAKEKERGTERRRGSGDKVEVEEVSKRGENQSSKRGKEISEWPIEEELRNPELERELEKRMRRRGEASSDKDRYQDDIKEIEDRKLSTRNDRSKDERRKNEDYGARKKDEKHLEDGERDRKNRDVKHRSDSGKYNKHKDDKYHEDGNKETKYKDDKYMETSDKDERSRDRKRRQDDDRDYRPKEEKRARDSKYRDVPEDKRSRDDNVSTDLHLKKTNNRDGSPVHDDRLARNKDEKDRRRGGEKDDVGDYRPHSSMKEQRSELEKRSSAKGDSASERGRPGSRYADVEISASHSRRRSSPSGSAYPTRDHHRFSKHEESKYRDYAHEDRPQHNIHSSRDYDSAPGQSDKKVTSKDDGYMGGDLSGEKRLRPDSRSSPQVDKSPSKSDARKSFDLEEPGQRSGGYKDTAKDGKGGNGSRELVNEVDNDNLSVSSPYTRNNPHFSGNSKSLLPPPSPSTFGSTEDDRSKSNNRHRRWVDPNMNRGPSQSQSQIQGNWNNNVPSWPSPMASGGYIPFQHVPPPIFHPIMSQFPPPMFGRPPMNLNPGLPYHGPDHGRPPFHGWDANNAVYDWDHRAQSNNRGWDQSGEMWNNQNAGGSMEVQSGQQKDGSTNQPDEVEQDQPVMQSELLNLDKNGLEAQKVTESPQILEVVKEDNTALISKAYLSRVDVSKDLTRPELYDQCTSLLDLDLEAISDEFDCKVMFLEEGIDADVTDGASLFGVINDSVFQKAMSLYKKQKEELWLTNTDNEKGGSDDDKSADEVVADGTVMEDSMEDDEREPAIKPEEPMDIEVDHAVVKQEEGHESTVVAVKESLAPSAGGSLPSEVEDASKCTDAEKNGALVLSDASTTDVAVMPTESIECGSVNLNRIHHHSPESTH